jgi:hypothetical protein
VQFDGGTTGWGISNAILGVAAVTRLRALNIDLLNGSDVDLVTATTGFIAVRYKSGSSRVTWTA